MRYIDRNVIKMFVKKTNEFSVDKFIDSKEEYYFIQLAYEMSAFVSTQIINGCDYEWASDIEIINNFYTDVYVPLIRPLYKEKQKLIDELIKFKQTDVRSVLVIKESRDSK